MSCPFRFYVIAVIVWGPIAMAARSKVWVCGRSLAGMAGSNPARRMDVCVLWVLYVVPRADQSPREALASVVCLNVIVKPRSWGCPGSLGAVVLYHRGGGQFEASRTRYAILCEARLWFTKMAVGFIPLMWKLNVSARRERLIHGNVCCLFIVIWLLRRQTSCIDTDIDVFVNCKWVGTRWQ